MLASTPRFSALWVVGNKHTETHTLTYVHAMMMFTAWNNIEMLAWDAFFISGNIQLIFHSACSKSTLNINFRCCRPFFFLSTFALPVAPPIQPVCFRGWHHLQIQSWINIFQQHRIFSEFHEKCSNKPKKLSGLNFYLCLVVLAWGCWLSNRMAMERIMMIIGWYRS